MCRVVKRFSEVDWHVCHVHEQRRLHLKTKIQILAMNQTTWGKKRGEGPGNSSSHNLSVHVTLDTGLQMFGGK
jgi:hypothetical protein